MKLDVQLFARARDLAGFDKVVLEMPATATVTDLRTALGEKYPGLHPLLPNLLVAVDSQYANNSTQLHAGCEIACFPPVSGG